MTDHRARQAVLTAPGTGVLTYRGVNAVAESFFGTLQLELLDQHHWASRRQLSLPIFEWIEAWYNPTRRHTSLENLSPNDYEARATRPVTAA